MRNRFDPDSGTIAQQTYKCDTCHQTFAWNQLESVDVNPGPDNIPAKRCPNCGGPVHR
jgi:DNA-directed RNA polymerase subunit RPC12/RpoP